MLALGLAWWALGEAAVLLTLEPTGRADTLLERLLLAPYESERVGSYYPFVPWLAVVLLGWAWGHGLLRRMARGERALRPGSIAITGLALLGVHAVLRGLGGYGNMRFPWVGPEPLGWLHVCKQPPSASFLCLELGLLALCLSLVSAAVERRQPSPKNPLLVFGRAALFFYVAHWLVLRVFASVSGMKGAVSPAIVWFTALVVVALLYPLCRVFLALKARRPEHWLLRYL